MGREISMFLGGLFFLIGALLNGFAHNIAMLIIGRLFLGFGVGYCNQVSIIKYHIHHYTFISSEKKKPDLYMRK